MDAVDVTEDHPDVPDVDFSHLPDVTWVRILQHLSLTDRYHVSVTCRALYDVFQHPSLWHTQVLHIIGHGVEFPDRAFQSSILDSYLNVTRNFGKYFQNLTLKVSGHLCDIQNELRELLQEVSENCRLETLTLDIGALISDFHQLHVEAPSFEAVLTLCSFVRNAYRLRHLHIRSWPLYEENDFDDCNVIKAVTVNEKLKGLETLTLFIPDSTTWTEREPILIAPAAAKSMLSHFKNLTHVGLRTPMVNEDILKLLADPERVKLERLDLFIHYVDPATSRTNQFCIPRVPCKVWEALCNRNPDFRVHATIFLPTPYSDLANLLKPEVPIASVTYMRYSNIDIEVLRLLYNHNTDTLTSFRSYCDSANHDDAIKRLVKSCKDLIEFVYHGEVGLETVVDIAKARGERWKKFEVVRKKIKVPNEFDDVDEDQVFARDRHGNLVLVSLMRHHRSEEDEQEAIDEMSAEVSKVLGYAWQPSSDS